MFVSHEKAARELGYAPQAAATALAEAAAWFSGNELLAAGEEYASDVFHRSTINVRPYGAVSNGGLDG